MLAERLLLAARVGNEKWYATLELEDSRAHLDDDDTPLGTDDVNAFELLQAHIGFKVSDQLEAQVGRMTLDLGSRRLVARNRFRNTLNSFTGVYGFWRRAPPADAGDGAGGKGGAEVRAFYFLPVDRLPSSRALLDDNHAKLDRDNSNARLWGLHVSHPHLSADLAGEVYVLGLDEEDRPSAPATRNRDFITTGVRVLRPTSADRWNFEIEAAFQTGDSRRSTSASDTTDLDHEAWFAHLHFGRKLSGHAKPRLSFLYDYASGDDDPNDGSNERFDTLFGARRFEFGPTGIYGLLARININSPGLKLDLTPKPGWGLMLAYRAAWLASSRDAFTTIGVQDPSGSSGSFIGHTVEGRLRLNPLPGNIGLELGAAHLFAGRFLTSQPSLGDTTYGYVMTTFTF